MKRILLAACLFMLTLPLWGRGFDEGFDIPARRSYFGYRFFIEGAYGLGMNIQTHPFTIAMNTPLRYFNAGTVQGIQVGSVFYTGAGVSYLQLIGDGVDPEQPIRHITPFVDFRFTFGGVFAAYLDLRPGVAFLWENKSWNFSACGGFGLDIARSFQLGFELNFLPLNIGKEDRATQMDALIGIHAGLSFGRDCKK